jgi:AmpD protein
LRHDFAHCCEVFVFRVDSEHWLEGARRCPSSNFDERSDADDISLLIVHGISLPPGRFGGDEVRKFFTNCLDCDAHPALRDLEGVRVSSHLFIDRLGAVTQFVPFDRRAWHAGVSSYQGRSRCNDFSIGVELEGTDDVPYEAAQYDVLADAAVALIRRYRRLSLSGIVGHQDVAPGRKTDPGAAFDWTRLLRGCLARMGA